MTSSGLGLGGFRAEDKEFEAEEEQQMMEIKHRHPISGGGRRRRRGAAGANGSPELTISSSSDCSHSSISSGKHKNGGGLVRPGGEIFSSAPGSIVDRCSFGSDQDGFVSQLSPLAASERCSRGGGGPAQGPSPLPLPSPDTLSTQFHTPPPPPPNPSKDCKDPEEEDNLQSQRERQEEVEDEELSDPAKHSFSQALGECQNLRCRSEALPLPSRRPRRRRPASLDFNSQGAADASLLFPRHFVGIGFAGMKKSSAASCRSRSGTFPSPGTPNYRHGAGVATAYQKGWSSERVPLPAYSSRRYVGSGSLVPFTYGRTLPSKWEDAEKWIFSPFSGDGIGRQSVPPAHFRRPKSKSGPLGALAGVGGAYSSTSPLVPCFDTGRLGNFTASSPFLTGVLMPERGCCVNGNSGRGGNSDGRGGGGGSGSGAANGDPYIARSASIHGWSDPLIESSSSLPSSHDEKFEGKREESSIISYSVLRKDAATQMSPEESTPSSPKERPSPSASSPSAHPIQEPRSHFSKLEVRDVQVDDRVTVTRWSKKHIARSSDRRSANIIEWKKKTVEADSCSWDVTETTKSISKYKREEAKITAWENLQKAKAEAEIRKLEMKLEKKRSSSMDKILNKLRLAQKKAQEMRSAMNAKQANQVMKTAKRASYFGKTGQFSSLSECFTCHAF